MKDRARLRMIKVTWGCLSSRVRLHVSHKTDREKKEHEEKEWRKDKRAVIEAWGLARDKRAAAAAENKQHDDL